MSRTGRIIVVPWQWFEEEREREYQQMIRDVESGKTALEALREKNALHLGDWIMSCPRSTDPGGPPARPDRSDPISAHNVACYTAL